MMGVMESSLHDDEEEHSYKEVNQDFSDWIIPKITLKEIYKSTFLLFRS